jgi:hypothetical protein
MVPLPFTTSMQVTLVLEISGSEYILRAHGMSVEAAPGKRRFIEQLPESLRP